MASHNLDTTHFVHVEGVWVEYTGFEPDADEVRALLEDIAEGVDGVPLVDFDFDWVVSSERGAELTEEPMDMGATFKDHMREDRINRLFA